MPHVRFFALALALLAPWPGVAPGIALADKAPPQVKLPRKGFSLIAKERGVSVYENDGGDLIWLGAVGIIPAPIDKVHEALLDYQRQLGKVGRVAEATVLSREEGAMYVYQRLSLPVIDDRDFTLRVTYGVTGPRRWIAYWAVTDHGPPPRDGIVRVTKQRGVWDLTPAPGGKGTLVRYEFRMDLGGDVPLWMVKSDSGAEVPGLFSQICKLSLPEAEKAACP